MQKTNALFNRSFLSLSLINLFMSISFSMVYTTMSSYVAGLGDSVAIAGLVTGVFSISSMAIRPFTGLISDRVNRKKLLICSTGLMGLAICGYSLFANTGAMLALRVLHGVAFAVSTTVNMAVIPGLVPRERIGEAVCYFSLSQSLASAVGPSVALAIANSAGFSATFLASSALCVIGAILAATLKMDAEEPRPRGVSKRPRLGDVFIARCLPYTLVDVAISAVSGLENSMLVLYAATRGIANIGWYFTINAVMVTVSRFFFGKLIDKRGTAVVYPGIALMIVGLLLLWRQPAVWMFAAAGALKTLGASLAKPALQVASVKAVSAEHRGAAVSTFYIGTDLGQGVAPMAAGRIVDGNGGDYGAAFAWFTLPLALFACAYHFLLRRVRGPEKGTEG